MIDSEQLMHDYADAVNRDVLPGIHWLGLKQSYANHDYEYPKAILKKLHDKFCEIYGTDTLDDSYEFVLAPAVIKVRQSNDLMLGLVQLDISSSGEHWDTDFITPCGVFNQNDKESNDTQLKYIRSFIPYDYFYTLDIPGDIHVDWDNCPGEVWELLEYCHTEQLEQNGGLNLE
jgi:hypothetical protein